MIKKSKIENAIIVILSFPDTIVRPAYWEPSSKIWPKIGIGNKHAIKAGHAALLLIKKNDSKINYFDFGRYITSYGKGRVRSEETDPEVYIPIKAKFKENSLINLKKILLWLEKHPERTHGNGRLIASTNHKINYDKAMKFINSLIDKKELPYGAFIKKGSNCARFVTDTIINSTTKKRIKLKLKSSYLLTPSPIGNTLKGKILEEVYRVKNQKIEEYKNRSILKEYKITFFNKFENELNLIGTELPDKKKFSLSNGTWLSGIGGGAWFKIENQLNEKFYKIVRYSYIGYKDFEAIFTINKICFDYQKEHQIVHPTNCKEVIIKQNNKIYTLQITKGIST